eukprot:m.354754 g.354754  ORF g.354754 m.354754 type:complete len:143 (-) comp17093_c0_seq1:1172-1600(-)
MHHVSEPTGLLTVSHLSSTKAACPFPMRKDSATHDCVGQSQQKALQKRSPSNGSSTLSLAQSVEQHILMSDEVLEESLSLPSVCRDPLPEEVEDIDLSNYNAHVAVMKSKLQSLLIKSIKHRIQVDHAVNRYFVAAQAKPKE